MLAKDVMTTSVVTVTPETEVREVARIFLDNRISGAPVVDANGRLIGIISEGDLLHRAESGTAHRPRSWWLELISAPDERSVSYVREHARHVGDVMTKDVATVDEEAPLDAVADLLEKRRIKRVPVMRGDRIVGIVSRANLLQGLIAAKPAVSPGADDRSIREQILKEFRTAGVHSVSIGVVVTAGVPRLFGLADSAAEKDAARVAAESVVGTGSVVDDINVMPGGVRARFAID